MRVGSLKRLRVILSLLFFVLTTVFFLDFSGIVAPVAAMPLLYLQFVPSLLKFAIAGGAAAAGFLAVLVLTLLFGRVYCSTICPLGTLQDLVIALVRRVRKRRGRRRFFKPARPHNLLRYGILIAAFAVLLSGSVVLFTLLDPFSNFGRIAANIARPLFLGANNVSAALLETAHSYLLYRVQWNMVDVSALLFALFVLVVVVWLSATHGRLYCNTLCPVGSLLGLVSRAALFKVRVVPEDCISCTLCERVCKSNCLDSKAMSVDMSRCVACFNCFTVCPTSGLAYTWKRKPEAKGTVGTVDGHRRRLLLWASVSVTGWSLASAQKKVIESSKPSTVPVRRSVPVTPPGSRSINHFTSVCTACHACISACPTRVLTPSLMEYGLQGFLQPRMNYLSGFCNFECTLCGDVCPSGAILPIEREQKKLTQIGTAKFIKDNCIVYTENTDCGACSEHCPTKAVTMVPYKTLVAPEVKEEFCIGCGACEYACPTRPYKAIYVEGKAGHGLAKKKEEQKIETAPAGQPDFPF